LSNQRISAKIGEIRHLLHQEAVKGTFGGSFVNRRELTKFQVPEVRDQYMDKYGDPLEEVSPQDLMDLMENLWTSNRGTYAVHREKLRREGHDPWSVRLALVEQYFRTLYLRQEKLDEQADALKVQDVTLFIQFRIDELIKQHQEREAEEARHTRDKFGIRAPRA
jgi:hypothetical protein